MLAGLTSRPRRSWVIGAVALGATLAVGATPAGAADPKADLVPASGQVSGSEYRFIGNRLNTEVEFETKNKRGKRAGPTVTKVYLQHSRRERYEFAAAAVPGLEAGETDRARDRVNGRNRFPAGRYSIVVCVDAKDQEPESNERNNCGQIEKKFEDFYSAYHQYAGTANGTGPGHPFEQAVRETWTATGVGFVWETYNRPGVFSYEVGAGGSAAYTVSGTTSTNCVFSGSRALPFAGLPQSYVIVDWKQENYRGSLAPGGGYEINSSCDPGNPTTGPLTGYVFQTQDLVLGGTVPLPFGSRSLQGSANDPLAIDTTNYSWNLAGG